ncbi:MAG: hypothetical protein IKD90_03250 [Clostridiales bacterium]|nr:hypothetical protein [Clostridiales bacterium]
MSEKIQNRDAEFERRSKILDDLYKDVETTADKLANLRGFLFIAVVVFLVLFFTKERMIWNLIIAFGFFVLFVVVAARHARFKNKLKRYKVLKEIHSQYIARTQHDFGKLTDTGADLQVEKHPFSSDLDLFGERSLFSLMSVAHTSFGRSTLRDWLFTAASDDPDREQIVLRQEAASEFAEHLDMLQDLEADTKMNVSKQGSPQALLAYIASDISQLDKKMVVLRTVCTILLWVTFVAALIIGKWAFFAPAFFFVVQLMLMMLSYGKNSTIFTLVEKFFPELRAYSNIFTSIEKAEVKSAFLVKLKEQLYSEKVKEEGEKASSASNQLQSLYRCCLLIQARMQPLLYFVLNMVFPFDELCIHLLEKWKHTSGKEIPGKLKAIGEWEAAMSLAVMRFIYPDGCVPKILTSSLPVFEAKEMGHPLIPEKKVVRNDFSLTKGCAIITGSNMSGKTTLLRTVGINMVLAYAGAVCPTSELSLSVMNLGASMRIEDNLGEGVSTFYAELIKIERIIRLASGDRPLLYLIDEIFRGTNSKDRTDGAWIVLKKLNKPSIIGLMSTHDYELCKMNSNNEVNLVYYHFSEYYDDEGLHFDYKLKDGMSTQTNAKYLMKLVGIDD